MERLKATPWNDGRAEPDAPVDASGRLALVTFGIVLVISLVLYLVLGRHQWFHLDEWDFLIERRAGNVDDLLRPHNEHWSTLPILAYRALFGVFGLRTYVPYQLTSILLHLTESALLLLVMRRSGVRPWIATGAASLFALFGAVSGDIVWAFGMTWSATLVFGLTHLLLADHDGPVDRRDWLGLAAGLAGLLCSGVAVTMTIAVGIAALIRRGWRPVLFHTVPLGSIYVLWWLTEARDSYGNANAAVSRIAHWAWVGTEATFDGLGQVTGAGIALAVLLVFGLVVAWRSTDPTELRRRAAAPAALVAGALLFLVISGIGRAALWGPSFARSDRYLHVLAALMLPALAVAADALVRRWRVAVPVVALLLVIGIPGNLEALSDYHAGNHKIPGWVHVARSIIQSDGKAEPTACTLVEPGVPRHLRSGTSLAVRGGPVRLFDFERGGKFLDYKVYDPGNGETLTARAAITLVVRPDTSTPIEVCAFSGRTT